MKTEIIEKLGLIPTDEMFGDMFAHNEVVYLLPDSDFKVWKTVDPHGRVKQDDTVTFYKTTEPKKACVMTYEFILDIDLEIIMDCLAQ